MLAAEHGNTDVVQALILAGANLDQQNNVSAAQWQCQEATMIVISDCDACIDVCEFPPCCADE